MMQINTPVENFFDTDGTALDDGYIYVGSSGLNPETNPQALFWDKEGLIPAAQPIRTRNGYPYRDGAAAKFYTETAFYSITVRNKTGALVFSSLNTDSGLFVELATPSGAANVGYDNTASGLAADNVQEAVDELKTDLDTLSDEVAEFTTGNAGVVNLFGNSAFVINSRDYVSGTATTSANQFTLDLISVVVSGQNLTFVAGEFGNRITAPAGGAEQIIAAAFVTGGDYACTWEGTGTIEVNGEERAKNATFTIAAETSVTIRMFGEFEQFMFTRPSMLGSFEYDYTRDLALCQPYSTRWQNTFSSASGTEVISPVMAPWVREFVVGFKDLSSTGSSKYIIQYETSAGWVTTGYLGYAAQLGSVITADSALGSGFLFASVGAGTAMNGDFSSHLIHPASHVWSGKLMGARIDSIGMSICVGTITLPGKMTRVRITTEGGVQTFDGGTVSFSWRG